jgi:heat shock protein HslJ
VIADGLLNLNLKTDSGNMVFAPLAGASEAGAAGTEASLVGPTWQWVETQTPIEKIEAADPARYTIAFLDNGTYQMLADCNRGAGDYTVDGSSITILPGAITMMACPPDSQADAFLKGLNAAAIYFMEDGNLFLDMKFDSGTMKFQPAQ